MKIVTIVLNIAVVVSSLIVGITDGLLYSDEGWFCLWGWLLVVTPVVSVVTLLKSRSDSWLSLYFRRKALEEKQRIADIGNKMEDRNS